jgi:radical SAM protein with 4Fe4S-binding SPASM domain
MPLSFLRYLSFAKIGNVFIVLLAYGLSRLLRRPIVWGRPFSLNLEVTNHCNLRCRECPSGQGTLTRPKGYLKYDDFVAWLGQFQDRLVHLTLYFQGEPFLHPDLLKMVAHAHQQRIHVQVSTNGHFFTDDETCRRIIDSGLGTLIVSLDGITERSYRVYRQGGSLLQVLDGLERFATVRRRCNSRTPRLLLQFLVLKHNEKEIPQVLELGLCLGADRVMLKSAQVYNFDDIEEILPMRRQFRRYVKGPEGVWKLIGEVRNTCLRLWNSTLVTWDGKVLPCCYDKDADHALGDLRTESFTAIWRNQRYQDFRQQVLSNRPGMEMCANCGEGLKVYG